LTNKIFDAVDRIVGGLEKKNKIVTPGERKQLLSMKQDTQP
jgi:hypothetical protein